MHLAKTCLGTLPVIGLLAACGAGEPLTADQVADLMRKDSVDDGYEVSYIYAEPKEEAGHFQTFVDRSKPGEEDSDETQICNVQATSMSNGWTCQTARPSMIAQGVAMLEGQYTGRNFEIADYDLRRTGEGLDFSGNVVLRNTQSGERIWAPCTGSQTGTHVDIECTDEGSRPLPPEDAPVKSTA